MGTIYFDEKLNILFGNPLIEAYKIGEGQDWIGLIFSETAEKKVATFYQIIPSLNYARVTIPVKEIVETNIICKDRTFAAYVIARAL